MLVPSVESWCTPTYCPERWVDTSAGPTIGSVVGRLAPLVSSCRWLADAGLATDATVELVWLRNSDRKDCAGANALA